MTLLLQKRQRDPEFLRSQSHGGALQQCASKAHRLQSEMYWQKSLVGLTQMYYRPAFYRLQLSFNFAFDSFWILALIFTVNMKWLLYWSPRETSGHYIFILLTPVVKHLLQTASVAQVCVSLMPPQEPASSCALMPDTNLHHTSKPRTQKNNMHVIQLGSQYTKNMFF